MKPRHSLSSCEAPANSNRGSPMNLHGTCATAGNNNGPSFGPTPVSGGWIQDYFVARARPPRDLRKEALSPQHPLKPVSQRTMKILELLRAAKFRPRTRDFDPGQKLESLGFPRAVQ